MSTLIFDLLARDHASKGFLAVAGAADKAAASTSRAATTMDRATAKASLVGSRMSKSITLPVAAALAVSVDQAAKFQKQQTLLQTAGGQTQQNVAKISKGIMGLAKSTGTSLSDLSSGAYIAAKASGAAKWTAVGQLQVLKAAAQGAKGELVPLGTSVSALTSVMTSYGYKARDAVKVEDMLVRGSGLAKTSFNDFAGSLSSVVPIAASLHISFAQVAGAIDTMTQHGETAQRATDNLSNLITNLAGQNNVAASAMGQLGISTVDLRKKLGTRGLTGTLDAVEHALAKHSHAGLVVVSAFKQSANATASMNTMLKTMQPEMAKTSKSLLTGGESIKDYNVYAKSLGGQAGASALQFLALYKASDGFSNQLKSGNGRISTTAATLQKMLGGVTGMRTALMLTGTSAKLTAGNVKAVGDAADGAGKNVLGWNKTSQLATTQLDMLKENAQTLSVSMGNALLPALSKLATEGTKAFDWVNGLSHGQKELLGWSLGAVAALGPVLTVGSRLAVVGRGIGTFATGASTKLAGFAGASEQSSARVGVAMGRVSAAVGGAAIGAAVGTLTKNSSTATKALGGLASAAAGAAIGFGAGGPVGALIGGVAGGLASLVTSFRHTGSSAQKAGDLAKASLLAQQQAASSLLGTLQQVNGAYSGQYKKQLISQLSGKGLLSGAQRVGVAPSTVVKAAMGDQDAITKLYAGLSSGKIPDKEFNRLTAAFVGVAKGAANAEKQYELQRLAGGHLAASTRPLDNSLRGLRKDFSSTGENLHTLATQYTKTGQQTTAVGLKTTAIIRDHITAANTDVLTNLRQGKSVTFAATAYEGQITSLRANLTQMGFNSAAIDKIIGRYAKIPASVATNLIKRGVLPADIQAIADKYHLIPNTVSTNVNANTGQASQALDALKTKVNSVVGNHIITLTTVENNGIAHGNTSVGRATGGEIHGRGTGTSDSNLIRASRGEFMVNAKQYARNKRLVQAINAGAPGFATGGEIGSRVAATQSWLRNKVNPLPYVFGAAGPGAYDCSGLVSGVIEHLTGHGSGRLFSTSNEGSVLPGLGFKRGSGNGNAAMVVGWEHDGHLEHTTGMVGGLKFEAYGSNGVALADQIRVGSAARDPRSFPNVMYLPGGKGYTAPEGDPSSSGGGGGSAKSRAKARASAASSRVGSLIGNIGQASSSSGPQINLSQTGIGRVDAQIAAARRSLTNPDLSDAARAKFSKQITDLAKLANKQLGALRVKIRGGDMRALRKDVLGTVADMKIAVAGLVTDLRHAGASAGTIAGTQRLGGRLLANQSKLGAMRTYGAGIAGTLRGAFDPTQYGSADDLIAGLTGAAGTNRTYGAELTKLHREDRGNPLLAGLVNKLAASGQTASLASLAGAGRGELARVTNALKDYNGSVVTGTNAAVGSRFGTSIDKQTHNVDKLIARVDKLATAVEHTNHRPVKVELHVDGHKMAERVVNGTEMEKVLGHLLHEVEHEMAKGHR